MPVGSSPTERRQKHDPASSAPRWPWPWFGISHSYRAGRRRPADGEAAADVVIGGAVVNAGVRPAGVGPAHTGAADVGAVYREIDPAAIEPNPRQPRQAFDEEALAELVHSINEFGMMQPIVVREIGDGAGSVATSW